MTTPLRLAQCQKCNAYVFNSNVAGIDTTVDPVKLETPEQIREALLAGKSLYRENSPKLLAYVGPRDAAQRIAQRLPMYATHACMVAGTVRTSQVELTPAGPPSAPATPGGRQGGYRPAPAPVSGSQGLTGLPIMMGDCSETCPCRANRATRRPSRCAVCNKVIWGDEHGIVAIEYNERVVWACHESC